MAVLRLDIHNASKSYPGVKALDSVSFSVGSREVHGLVGGNGAGKSTLMAIASGASLPDTGQVRINGTLLTGGPSQARELGLAIVRQEPSLMPDLTVAENIFLGQGAGTRPSAKSINAWASLQLKRWSDDINIDPRARIETLPPEQRFIVEIAKALACAPTVLILDEPTEHLATEDKERLFEFVRKLAAKGTAIVYISHRIHDVRSISGRITVLRDGVTQGTYDKSAVSDGEIVELIVGRRLDREFPQKPAADPGAPVVLSVKNYFGTGFDAVNVDVRAGEIVGFAGIDANGQREFLRALAGLNAGSGSIVVGGRAVTIRTSADAARAGLRYLPGDRHREGIFSHLSVRENFAIRLVGNLTRGAIVDAKQETGSTQAAVKQFAVKTPTIDTPIGSLSGGNQQKVVLASVLASNPDIVIVDEPTQGVDIGTRAEIYRTLREAAKSGRAVLVVSSDTNEIAGLCDRVVIFSRGNTVAELEGAVVTESAVTEAILTATAHRKHNQEKTSAFRTWLAGDSAPVVMIGLVVLALGLYASWINPFYFTARNFSGMLPLIATLALVAFGQQILMLIGAIDLSVGPLMGLIVVVASFFLNDGATTEAMALGWGLMLAVAVGAGLVNWSLVDLAGLHPMVATLATYIALQAISLVLRPFPDGMIASNIMDFIGIGWGAIPVSLIVAVALAACLELLLFKSTVGLSLRGFGSRNEAAQALGINAKRTRLLAYVGCSVFAGLAAVTMTVQVGAGDPTAGITYTLTSIAAGVIGGTKLFGGRGSFIGTLLGATLIIQISVVTAFLDFNAAAQNYLLGAMIIVAVALYSKSRQGVQVA